MYPGFYRFVLAGAAHLIPLILIQPLSHSTMPGACAPARGTAIRPILAPGADPLLPIPEVLFIAVLVVDFPKTNLEAMEELALLGELAVDRVVFFVLA